MSLLRCLWFSIPPYNLETRGTKWTQSSSLSSVIGKRFLGFRWSWKPLRRNTFSADDLISEAYCKQTHRPCSLVLTCVSGVYAHRQTCAHGTTEPLALLSWNWAHYTFPWSIDLIKCISCWGPISSDATHTTSTGGKKRKTKEWSITI